MSKALKVEESLDDSDQFDEDETYNKDELSISQPMNKNTKKFLSCLRDNLVEIKCSPIICSQKQKMFTNKQSIYLLLCKKIEYNSIEYFEFEIAEIW